MLFQIHLNNSFLQKSEPKLRLRTNQNDNIIINYEINRKEIVVSTKISSGIPQSLQANAIILN